jgi:hypothetical protein
LRPGLGEAAASVASSELFFSEKLIDITNRELIGNVGNLSAVYRQHRQY